MRVGAGCDCGAGVGSAGVGSGVSGLTTMGDDRFKINQSTLEVLVAYLLLHRGLLL